MFSKLEGHFSFCVQKEKCHEKVGKRLMEIGKEGTEQNKNSA